MRERKTYFTPLFWEGKNNQKSEKSTGNCTGFDERWLWIGTSSRNRSDFRWTLLLLFFIDKSISFGYFPVQRTAFSFFFFYFMKRKPWRKNVRFAVKHGYSTPSNFSIELIVSNPVFLFFPHNGSKGEGKHFVLRLVKKVKNRDPVSIASQRCCFL